MPAALKSPNGEFLNTIEVAQLLKVGRRRAKRIALELGYKLDGNTVRVRRSAIDRWLRQYRVPREQVAQMKMR
jgi:hypothetical protein